MFDGRVRSNTKGFDKIMIEILAMLSMLALLIGTIPAYFPMIKNRKQLRGFSRFGSFLIMLGQYGYAVYFLLLKDWITTVFTIPLCLYWFLVSYFLLRNK